MEDELLGRAIICEALLQTVDQAWSWAGLKPAELVDWNSFGNLIVRSVAGEFWRIIPEELQAKVIAASQNELDQLRADPNFAADWEMAALHDQAFATLGPLTEGYCYCLKRPAVLGGSYTLENIGKSPMLEMIGFSGDVGRQIQNLPDGAEVILQITQKGGRSQGDMRSLTC